MTHVVDRNDDHVQFAHLVFYSEEEPDHQFVRKAAIRIAQFLNEDVEKGKSIQWMTESTMDPDSGEAVRTREPGVWRYGYMNWGDGREAEMVESINVTKENNG